MSHEDHFQVSLGVPHSWYLFDRLQMTHLSVKVSIGRYMRQLLRTNIQHPPGSSSSQPAGSRRSMSAANDDNRGLLAIEKAI